MKLFDNNGKMKFPEPRKPKDKEIQPIVISECFCQNGHDLINKKVNFDNYPGIYIKIKNNNKEGYIGLSPFCGLKSRISIDINLEDKEQYQFYCPECEIQLPVYSPCPSCTGNLITMFRDKHADYANCIGICSTVGCTHAEIKTNNEIRTCLSRKYSDEGELY